MFGLHLGHKSHSGGDKPGSNPTSPKSGQDVLKDSKLNKFTSFSKDEREANGVRGLLPHAVEDQEKQMKRELAIIRRKNAPIEKYLHLMGLLDRNERMFYYLMTHNVEEMVPIVYTPTVGEVCTRFSELMMRPMGVYITLEDAGHVERILQNWKVSHPNVRAIVITDGERILGLGDLGANGMGIPIGKLQLYVAMGGIDPEMTLPVTLDVGTNNEKLRDDELYTGARHPRERGDKYFALIEEFVQAVKKCFGDRCLIQWEDFGNTTAFEILHKYQNNTLCFNDDIQGTAAVTLAGVISSLRVSGPIGGAKTLKDHTFCFLGAGEAGVGIADLIADAMSREVGCTKDEARKQIWLVDSTGLVCKERKDKLAHHKLPYAHALDLDMKTRLGLSANGEGDLAHLEKIVTGLKATCLIGVSATPNTFTEKVCKAMMQNCERPLIFALSNPTDKAECTAEQAINWTDAKCMFCSGSPFAPVQYGSRQIKVGQANNSYIFPGVALGAICAEVKYIPDELMEIAARSLANQVTDEDFKTGSLFPPLNQIRSVSAKIAADVVARAYDLGLARHTPRPANLEEFCKSKMYSPNY
jgi:malate dehydrogenase (oxaloacetate-decarboxylating)(NADP+)